MDDYATSPSGLRLTGRRVVVVGEVVALAHPGPAAGPATGLGTGLRTGLGV